MTQQWLNTVGIALDFVGFMRRATFLVSTGLIVLGFVLQMLDSWPGCCPPWIAPQS